MKRISFLIVLLGYYLTSPTTYAQPLDLADDTQQAIGQRAEILQERNAALSLSSALEAYEAGRFIPARTAFLNFGIGAQPVWLYFRFDNPTAHTLIRRLSIETAWLDKLAVYFLHDGELVKQYQVGDSLPFKQRSVQSRYFEFDYQYPAGSTSVLIRVDSTDPMTLPIFLRTIPAAHADHTFESYGYGFIYGALIALMAYNLMLFFTLRGIRYLFYALFLTSFILMNIAYSGHGFQWLWPNATHWQRWSNPVLMIVFSFSGLAFAAIFLETRRRLPGLHYLVVMICTLVAIALLVSIISSSQYSALLVAFSFVFIFSFAIVLLGGLSLYHGNRSAKYFLVASITHVTMSSVTAMTVWGLIPYTTLGYRAIEIAMVIDAILLSIALADQLRIINEGKLEAERLAMTDHLTGINNRRAFYDRVTPQWNTGQRKQRDMSIILMDIDYFKSINDNYGHPAGDTVLIHLAHTLKDNVRVGDIVARWSGDEFILFLPETSLDEATEIAERFREIIEQSVVETDKGNIRFTSSIGIAHNVVMDVSLDDLIKIADMNLYKAKQQGRNKVFARHLTA